MQQLFEDNETHYAYSCIHHCFDVFHVSDAVYYLHSIVYAACGRKVWKKDVPANLIYFIEKLEGLTLSMYILHNNISKRPSAIIEPLKDGSPDISLAPHYKDSYMKAIPGTTCPAALLPCSTLTLIRQ